MSKKKLLKLMEGKHHDRKKPYSRKARTRCNICGKFTDKNGHCKDVSGGYFEPAEHF